MRPYGAWTREDASTPRAAPWAFESQPFRLQGTSPKHITICVDLCKKLTLCDKNRGGPSAHSGRLLEQLKFDLPHSCCLRRRLAASRCIGNPVGFPALRSLPALSSATPEYDISIFHCSSSDLPSLLVRRAARPAVPARGRNHHKYMSPPTRNPSQKSRPAGRLRGPARPGGADVGRAWGNGTNGNKEPRDNPNQGS